MHLCDVEPSLKILDENKLESWKYDDFVLELKRADSIILTAKASEKVVGFCVSRLIMHYYSDDVIVDKLNKNTAGILNECEIYNIAVKKHFQKQGIGYALLNQTVLCAREYDCQSIWLEVRQSNEKAIDFYEKNDFRRMYERKKFYSNPIENAIVMKRDLGGTYINSKYPNLIHKGLLS